VLAGKLEIHHGRIRHPSIGTNARPITIHRAVLHPGFCISWQLQHALDRASGEAQRPSGQHPQRDPKKALDGLESCMSSQFICVR
jgi:hypothetical protein